MYWYYMSENLQTLEKMRRKVIEQNLTDSGEANERKIDKDMLNTMLTRSSSEIETFVSRNKARLSQFVVEQRSELEQRRHEQKKLRQGEEADTALALSARQRRIDLNKKRERDKEKMETLHRKHAQERGDRADSSMEWLHTTRQMLRSKRMSELERKERLLKKRHLENKKHFETQKQARREAERERRRKQSELNKLHAKAYNLWTTKMRDRKRDLASKTKERQRRHNERMNKLKAADAERQRNLLHKIAMQQATQMKLQRSKSMQLLAKAKSSAMHREHVSHKHAESANALVAELVLKQKEADKRRAVYQLQRQKESARKQIMYTSKKNQTLQRMRRMQRAKQFQRKQTMQKLNQSDVRYRRGRDARDAVLEHKLLSNTVLQDEKGNIVERSEHFVQHDRLHQLDGLIQTIPALRFGVEKLDLKSIGRILTAKSEVSSGRMGTQRSGTEILTQRARLQIKYSEMRNA